MNLYKKLFSPYSNAQNLKLKNHIVMAPLIQRTAKQYGIPDMQMFEFYTKRAGAGLIITEATMVSKNAKSYSKMPGIYSSLQTEFWKPIVREVHKKRSKIFIQLWHPGRMSNKVLLKGKNPVAPSAIQAHGKIPWSHLEYSMPKAMTESDISEVISHYEIAALNATSVRFDGIELHAANGYLLEQFLRDEANQRNDEYGGTPEKKTTFPIKVIEAVLKKVGPYKVGIRISIEDSPTLKFGQPDIDTYIFFIEKLNEYPLSYIHLCSNNDFFIHPLLGCFPSQFLKKYTKHPLIACGSYNPSLAERALCENKCDLVSFGRLFLQNSNWIENAQNIEHEKLIL